VNKILSIKGILLVCIIVIACTLVGCTTIIDTPQEEYNHTDILSEGVACENDVDTPPEEYDYTNICGESASENELKTNSNDTFCLLGVWLLEEIVFRPTEFIDDTGYSYSIPIDVDRYIGYTMEFAADFVKLRDRVMTYPIYELSNRSTWLQPEPFFANDIFQQVFGNFNSIKDLVEKGVDVIYVRDYTFFSFDRINFTYPQYPELWRRMYWKFDPILGGSYEFHPLFREITVINDDFILIGWRERILARRVG